MIIPSDILAMIMKNILYFLPPTNALLNGISLLFLIAGIYYILHNKVERHRKMMSYAMIFTALFLMLYLGYHFSAAPVHYSGKWRGLYLFILISHIFLAALNVPLVSLTIHAIVRKNNTLHKKWARITLPVWMYVNLTGILVFFFNWGNY